uniref:Ig-like domain-containing protein n=1 Tax=Cyprinus carpio carpio TaxID=630221 RepID=A0A8C1CDH6_CYPCA
MGSSALSLTLLLMSLILAGLTQDLPRPTLTVTPDSVFTGERVSLKCVINSDHSDWRYEWNKDSTEVSERYTVNTNTLTIERSETSDAGRYTCKGHIDRRSVSSQSSFAVSLSVKALPRTTLTVTPDSPVFTGERVILKCVINSDHSDWRYEWYKGSVMLQTSERYTVNRDTLTIRGATASDQGQFWCRGHRDGRSVSSQSSSAVSLTVKDSPRSTLTVTPDSPVFTGERVNLTCVIESYSNWRQRNGLKYDRRYDWTPAWRPEWRYEWYKGSVMLQTSERYTVNRDTLTIRGATESDQDQFWCRGQKDERPKSSQSRSVSLTVKDLPRSTLTVTPDSPVFTGETVNLTCVINSNHSDWRYEWYKGGNNSVMLQTSERYTIDRDTLNIRGATESDQDQFWCRGQRDERPNSSQESERINLSVNGNRNWEVQIWA